MIDHRLDETAIDLQLVETEFAKIAERRMAGAVRRAQARRRGPGRGSLAGRAGHGPGAVAGVGVGDGRRRRDRVHRVRRLNASIVTTRIGPGDTLSRPFSLAPDNHRGLSRTAWYGRGQAAGDDPARFRPVPPGTARRIFREVLFQAARVDADADRATVRLRRAHHLRDPFRRADIARIDPQARRPGVGSLERALVVEMDVGDDRHLCRADDLRQRGGTVGIRTADADDSTSAPPRTNRSITGTTRFASSSSHTSAAPGRVDSPPTSISAAPAPASAMPAAAAPAGSSLYAPPSEKLRRIAWKIAPTRRASWGTRRPRICGPTIPTPISRTVCRMESQA